MFLKMTEEIWKPISGYEGKYQISNLGRVKSLKDSHGNYREKILKPVKVSWGYLQLHLYLNGKEKYIYVHRLVAEAFIENPYNLSEVNHKDENKENNSVDNLEWCTRQYNNCYGTKLERSAKSKSKKVACYKDGKIIKVYDAIKDTKKDGFHRGSVSFCCQGKQKSHLGYQWRYLED